MAEIEMDVDMAPPLNFDENIDEDLIDYDIDTTEDHNQAPWALQKDEQMYDDVTEHALGDTLAADTNMDEPSTYVDEKQGLEEGVNDEDIHDGIDAAGIQPHQDDITAPSDIHEDIIDTFDHEETKNHANVDKGQNIASGSHEEVDEIDYEDDEPPTAQESHDDQAQQGEVVKETGPTTRPKAEEIEEEPVATVDKHSGISVAEIHKAISPEPAIEAHEDEISWEHVEHDESNATVNDDAERQTEADIVGEVTSPEKEQLEEDLVEVPDSKDKAHMSDHDEDNVDVSPEQDEATAIVEEVEVEVEVEVEAEQEQEEDGGEEVDQNADLREESASPPAHSNTNNLEFPSITVQYKGDEFPLFSQTASEGFFMTQSVLDESMESFLAGLRAELANEIAADEEIVFQVDELGLEFVESSPQAFLSSITLRQILEIFDLLVKNQDPDNSRTLYTYIFTKLNTSKRYESLVESAAAGKGLEDVIHLFGSTPHNANVVITNDDLTEESVDSHANFADVDGEADEEEDNTLEDDIEEPEENENEQQPDINTDFEADAIDHKISQNGVDEDALQNEEENHVDAIDEDESGGQAHFSADEVVDEPDHQSVDEKQHQLQDMADTNEPADGESDPLLALELDGSLKAEEDNIDNDQIYDEETEPEKTHEAPFQVDDELANESIADTSTTNTLGESGDVTTTLVDADANDLHEDEAKLQTLTDEDELQEIDWRDEIESPSGNTNDAITTTPSGASKRPRIEDEHSVEEQDVKRRRP